MGYAFIDTSIVVSAFKERFRGSIVESDCFAPSSSGKSRSVGSAPIRSWLMYKFNLDLVPFRAAYRNPVALTLIGGWTSSISMCLLSHVMAVCQRLVAEQVHHRFLSSLTSGEQLCQRRVADGQGRRGVPSARRCAPLFVAIPCTPLAATVLCQVARPTSLCQVARPRSKRIWVHETRNDRWLPSRSGSRSLFQQRKGTGYGLDGHLHQLFSTAFHVGAREDLYANVALFGATRHLFSRYHEVRRSKRNDDDSQRTEWCRVLSLHACLQPTDSLSHYCPPNITDPVVAYHTAVEKLPVSSRIRRERALMVFVGTFKLDISFRSSRLSTAGPRWVVDRRPNIDDDLALWAAALERLCKFEWAPIPDLAVSGFGTVELRDISNPDKRRDIRTSGHGTPNKALTKPAREFAGHSVRQPPHKGEQMKGRNGFLSHGGLFRGAWHPRSLTKFVSFGEFHSLGTEGATW